MHRRGWGAVTLPNIKGGITIRYWLVAMPDVREHEQIHVRQIQRMGGVRFLATYAWLWLRHGYANHPMERE